MFKKLKNETSDENRLFSMHERGYHYEFKETEEATDPIHTSLNSFYGYHDDEDRYLD